MDRCVRRSASVCALLLSYVGIRIRHPPVSVDKSLPSSGALVSCQHLEGGGLSCSVHSQQPEALSWADPETEPVHRLDAAHLPGFVHLTETRWHPLFKPVKGEGLETHLCERYLSHVFNLQHVTVGVPSQHSLSFAGHVHVIIVYGLAAHRDSPGFMCRVTFQLALLGFQL